VVLRDPVQVRRQHATTICRNETILKRGRERERKGGLSPAPATMRHFIINPPVAPPLCARSQSEIQIKHANICVFYSRGFVDRPRFVTRSQNLIRFVINTSTANYLAGRTRGRGREKEGQEKKCTREKNLARRNNGGDRFFRKIEWTLTNYTKFPTENTPVV